MRILRRVPRTPQRADVWHFIDALMQQAQRSPVEDAQRSTVALAVLATWEGTKRGTALELLYVVAVSLFATAAAFIPSLGRVLVRPAIGKPRVRRYVTWLFWAFIGGGDESRVAICTCEGCAKLRAESERRWLEGWTGEKPSVPPESVGE